MRLLLTLWFLPLVLFWGWYALSVNDVNFGFIMLSRQVHDAVFDIYANTLHVDRAALPGMIAGACAFDSAIVMAIAAFRWRASWLPQARAMLSDYWEADARAGLGDGEAPFKAAATGPAHPAE
ncbi:MAG: hypothetical protein KDJ80_12205 [Nitratireductor sp.]|nr:hypothetical protein [Nitratireductor sp.]